MLSPEITQQLISIIKSDHTLGQDDKNLLINKLQSPSEVSKLLAGISGASFALLLARFLHMGKTTQVIMTLAGFGIGRLLLERIEKPDDTSKVLQYKDKLNYYDIKP